MLFSILYLILNLSGHGTGFLQLQPVPEASPTLPVSSPTVLIPAPEIPEQSIKFKKCPDRIVQGQFAELILSAPVVPGGYVLSFGGQEIPFYLKTRVQESLIGIYRNFLAIQADLKPGGYTLQVKDAQHQVLFHKIVEVRAGRFFSQNIRYKAPVLTPEQQLQVEKEEQAVTAARHSQIKEQLWKGPFSLPVPHRINAPYGTRRYLNGYYKGYHSGVDFASPHGYPVKAPANARVALARYFSKGNSNGHTVFLDHGQGITSVYIHLSKLAVKEGTYLTQGQVLGYIGSTGRSTGPHLHWGFYLNGQNTDGVAWVRFSQKNFH